ncbi:TPA: radical SAM protein [Candidatus Poribacteria bacterium]|nr:radical SAM protein [Candidatus Poribacteria bacterium]
MVVNRITCKTILTKSGIGGGYTLNPYFGCQHSCLYCYARYLLRYRPHDEPWGGFVDVKCNADEVLEREIRRKKPGSVFLSTACDAYQPIESELKLTRRILKILADSPFQIKILTKSSLVRRDLPILAEAGSSSLGVTVTTVDERIRSLIEPLASPSSERLAVIEEAKSLGIETWVMAGPLMPLITDSIESLERLFTKAKEAGASFVYVDKLNKRGGVWESVSNFLSKHRPGLVKIYRRYFFDTSFRNEYLQALRERVRSAARKAGWDEGKIHMESI